MKNFLFTPAVFAFTMLAMALDVMVSGRRLRGSCGRTGEDCSCSWIERRTCPLRKARAAR